MTQARWFLLSAGLLSLLAAGCARPPEAGRGDELVCTAEAVPSVRVVLTAQPSDIPQLVAVVKHLASNESEEHPVSEFIAVDGSSAVADSFFFERLGAFSVRVLRNGVQVADRSPVSVASDGCHPKTADVLLTIP